MNIIVKARRHGRLNAIYKEIRKKRSPEELQFGVSKIPRKSLERLFVVCGRVGKEDTEAYRQKAGELGASFVTLDSLSWSAMMSAVRREYDPNFHHGLLLIGSSKQTPTVRISYHGVDAWTDFFTQDIDGDGLPETPVGRVFGDRETVLYHMDPDVIDSNIAVIFDSQPGRSSRHTDGLVKLGFDVEVLKKYSPDAKLLLEVCEFILQFSDGVYSSRIHGTPDAWKSVHSVIMSYEDVQSLRFKGYPVVYSEACSTARDGPLLTAFLQGGACYVGATLDTSNNIRPFDDWRECAYSDGWKFGFLDLLDTYPYIGLVKVNVDRAIYEHLLQQDKRTIQDLVSKNVGSFDSETALSTIEWQMFGNPMRTTTVGPNPDYTPGRIIVDT